MVMAILSNPTFRVILTIVVVIILGYILIKFRATKNPTEDSLDILKKRLEKGEISEADYKEAKKRQGKK